MSAPDERPSGRLVESVARVVGQSDELVIEGTRIRLEGGGGGGGGGEFGLRSYDFPEGVFPEQQTSVRDLFEGGCVASVVDDFVAGIEGCVALVGGTDAPKRQLASDLVPLIGERLFEQLAAKGGHADGASAGAGGTAGGVANPRAAFWLEVTFYEVFDEMLTDLLRPSSQGGGGGGGAAAAAAAAAASAAALSVEEHPTHGVVVRGATRREVRDAPSLTAAFVEGQRQRNGSSTEGGPAAQHTTAVLQLDLVQSEPTVATATGLAVTRSRLLLVDLPGTEKLARPAVELNAEEGPTRNRAALAVQAVCAALQQPERADFAPHSESVVTRLLQEALGGSCRTLCVAVLAPAATTARTSLETLRLAAKLQRVSGYPLPNTDHLQALLRRRRVAALRHLDQIEQLSGGGGAGATLGDMRSSSGAATGGGGPGGGGGGGAVAKKLHDLEGRVIKDNLEKMQLKEENERIHEKLLEFREKYNALVAAKQAAQRSLLAAEEDKLKLQKLLLDVQIERTQEAEGAQVAQHTLETRLIDAQNDVLEWEMRETTREKGASDLGAEFDAATQRLRETEARYAALTESYKALQLSHEAAQAKVQQLSVELLNLVNERNVLSTSVARLESELSEVRLRHGESGREAERLRASTRELETALLERTEELTALREAKVRAELSLLTSAFSLFFYEYELTHSSSLLYVPLTSLLVVIEGACRAVAARRAAGLRQAQARARPVDARVRSRAGHGGARYPQGDGERPAPHRGRAPRAGGPAQAARDGAAQLLAQDRGARRGAGAQARRGEAGGAAHRRARGDSARR